MFLCLEKLGSTSIEVIGIYFKKDINFGSTVCKSPEKGFLDVLVNCVLTLPAQIGACSKTISAVILQFVLM